MLLLPWETLGIILLTQILNIQWNVSNTYFGLGQGFSNWGVMTAQSGKPCIFPLEGMMTGNGSDNHQDCITSGNIMGLGRLTAAWPNNCGSWGALWTPLLGSLCIQKILKKLQPRSGLQSFKKTTTCFGTDRKPWRELGQTAVSSAPRPLCCQQWCNPGGSSQTSWEFGYCCNPGGGSQTSTEYGYC